MYEQILYEVAEPAAIITLNRPKQLNAWTDRMGAEVKHALAQAEADKRVVAIVLTGAGRGFCAGADMFLLKSISEGGSAEQIPAELDRRQPGDPRWASDSAAPTRTCCRSGSRSSPPSTARSPAWRCRSSPAATSASPAREASFTTAFSRRGLIAEWGSSWILPRLLGPAHALDLLFSARKIDAAEAERIGLVNRVVADEELLRLRPPATSRSIAANCSPTSMMIMKRQVYQHLTADLGAAEKEAVGLMLDSFKRPDFREGVVSFLEKRPPRFPRV